MTERKKFLITSLVAYLLLVLVGVAIAIPDVLFAQTDGAIPSTSSSDAAWKAVERIDNKIANAIIFLTIFSALIPLVIVFYESSKLKELHEIRTGQQQTIKENISIELANRMRKLDEKHIAEISHMLHSSAEEMSTTALRFLQQDDAQTGRIIAAFLNNEVGDKEAKVSNSELAQLFHLQRSLRDLSSEDACNIHTALVHVGNVVNDVTFSTAVEIYRYLWLIERQGKIFTLSNRQLWAELSKKIRELHDINTDLFESKTDASSDRSSV